VVKTFQTILHTKTLKRADFQFTKCIKAQSLSVQWPHRIWTLEPCFFLCCFEWTIALHKISKPK